MSRHLILLPLLIGSAPAVAQQTANNAVTQADDAFGRAVGTERIGIYSNEEVRGFNPIDAGNNRLEGLFIELGQITSPRLIDSSSVRVGVAARGTPFPAPTGIVELRMEKFTGSEEYSAEIEGESYDNYSGALEAKIPLSGSKLGLALGFGYRNADQVHGRNGSFHNYAAGISYLPAKGSEFILFTSGAIGRGLEYAPTVFPSGSFEPPKQPRKLQQLQPWALSSFNITTSGGIAKFPLAGFRIEAGLFRSTREDPKSFFTLQLGANASGNVSNLIVIADQDNFTRTTSGEFRLIREWTSERVRQSVVFALRGRDQDRAFGGQQNISLGASQLGVKDYRPVPAITYGPDDHSNVRQFIAGLQYNVQAKSGSSLSIGVQKAQYRKRNDFANPSLTDTGVRDAPWLLNVNGALSLAPHLIAYGGYVRGQEDSAVAPDVAINRSEAPPALRTRQVDAGLKYNVTPKLTLIAGVFEIRKPFYGIDSGLRFGNLGTVSNRGAELSLAGSLAPGLTVIAGGILVNPTIKGPEVDAGRLGKQPTGSFKKRGVFNLDWRPGGTAAWSLDLALDGTSGVAGNRINSFTTGARSNISLGGRYRFTVSDKKILLRAQLINALNDYGWRVNSGGGFSFTTPRSLFMQAVVDF